MTAKVTCIVAAGGSGTRMGENINKLFLEIGEIPVIAHTLLALQKNNYIEDIIISAREEDIIYMRDIVNAFDISKVKTIVKGGQTRGESVLCASKEIDSGCDFVMVHDGARPCITDDVIERTVEAAVEFNAAACGVKPKCTLKSLTNDGVIEETVDREKTVEIQTPQVFSKELFKKMYSFDKETIKNATDDCILAEKSGTKIKVTEGSYKNIKVTTPEDLEIAEIFLRR